MLEIREYPGSNLLETIATGKIEKEDYDELEEIMERKIDRYNTLRWIFEMKDFDGWEPEAFIKEAKLELKHLNDFEKIAVVGDKNWHKWVTKSLKPFMPEHTRLMFFETDEKSAAKNWMDGIY